MFSEETSQKACYIFVPKQKASITSFPLSNWIHEFNGPLDSTLVSIEIKYDELADLEKIIEMGFKEGLIA